MRQNKGGNVVRSVSARLRHRATW